MIIGQGQLDAILTSSSESRRAVIEEAAGVLKHRRRKERAERRLDQVQENLERLGDLVREVRRQMRPLERQAASARSYADVESELRSARHALFAQRLNGFEQRRRTLESELATSSSRERELRHELVTLDAQASTAAAEMASRREEMLASTLGTLAALSERARGTLSLIQERERSVQIALVASADENVIATLEADGAKLTSDLAALNAEEARLAVLRRELTVAQVELTEFENHYEVTWGPSSSDSTETELKAALERVTLLERSLGSLHESERRTSPRCADATTRRLARARRPAAPSPTPNDTCR
jgi:chromosome segregation protein